jgi:hypothetical protein
MPQVQVGRLTYECESFLIRVDFCGPCTTWDCSIKAARYRRIQEVRAVRCVRELRTTDASTTMPYLPARVPCLVIHGKDAIK